MAANDKGLGLSTTDVSRVDVILNKINQIEVCKYVSDCAKTLSNDITADVSQPIDAIHPNIKSADLARATEELQQLIEQRKEKEKELAERQTILREMLRRLQLRSEQPDFGYHKVNQNEKIVINKINCMRVVGSALATLPEHDPNTMEEAMKHLSQLEQLSGVRTSEYYNFLPENQDPAHDG